MDKTTRNTFTSYLKDEVGPVLQSTLVRQHPAPSLHHHLILYIPVFPPQSVQPSDDVLQRSLKPKMLQGEIEACRAERVLLCSPLASKDKEDEGEEGLLVITNFKLSFVTTDETQVSERVNRSIPSSDTDLVRVSFQNPNFICQENMFLGRNDVTLSNIDHIYQIVDKKKKLLTTGYKISARIDYLVVVCKNFRMFRLGFTKSVKGAGKYIAEALLKLPFPNNHTLLFGYTFK